MGSQTAPDWHSEPLGALASPASHPHTQKEFDIDFSHPPLLLSPQVGSAGGTHLKACAGARQRVAFLPTRQEEQMVVAAF